MRKLEIDFEKALGRIKPMHAVGQPPIFGKHIRTFHYLSEAAIPYARLHDVAGGFGRNLYVDIPNIFRDFDADENDPASYDFVFTDFLLEKLDFYGIAPIFRLGVTIENYRKLRAYRIDPPKDYGKWARVCEHIVRHYNEGWANGFRYGIRYWEIWNEPENRADPALNEMWSGTAEQYFELYDVTAKHLKAAFGDSIRVGGYASCGFYAIYADPARYGMDVEPKPDKGNSDETAHYRMDFLTRFLAFVKKNNSPLDFFSWHSYSNVEHTCRYADYLDRVLNEYGFGNVETMLNEWNNKHKPEFRGTAAACAHAAAMMLAFQNKKTDILCYYDARVGLSEYGGLFDPEFKSDLRGGFVFRPFPAYYAFAAFGKLYRLGTQVSCTGAGEGVYAVAAKDETGKHRALMIANIGEAPAELITDLPAGFTAYLADKEHRLTEVAFDPAGFTLDTDQVVLFTL